MLESRPWRAGFEVQCMMIRHKAYHPSYSMRGNSSTGRYVPIAATIVNWNTGASVGTCEISNKLDDRSCGLDRYLITHTNFRFRTQYSVHSGRSPSYGSLKIITRWVAEIYTRRICSSKTHSPIRVVLSKSQTNCMEYHMWIRLSWPWVVG